MDLFFLLLAEPNLKADIMKNHLGYSVPSGKWSDIPGFFSSYFCPNKFFSNHEYALKGFYKELPFYEFIKLLVLAKRIFKLPKNQGIISFYHVKLSLWVFGAIYWKANYKSFKDLASILSKAHIKKPQT